MTASFKTLKSSKAQVLVTTCEHPGCRKPAPFGEGFSGKLGKLGVWYCAEHRPTAKQGGLFK